MSKVTSPIMRYHGAKWRLAPWVIQFFPKHKYYVEAFGGSAAVLMQKERSYGEVYNDLDQDIFNLFKVLRDRSQTKELIRLCELTPFSRDEFELAYEKTDCPIEKARRTLFRAYAGFGSASATKGKSGFRTDIFRNYKNPTHLWTELPGKLDMFTNRLASVQVENKNALDLIEKYDTEQTLFYLDPPYVLDTRTARAYGYYREEMTDDQHDQLIDLILQLKGFVIISGYDHEIYDRLLNNGWKKRQKSSRISSNRGTETRIECLWMNPKTAEQQGQQSLFKEAL
ncbi:DNA adenine methylase [Hydrogenovibrio sp. 3SP14C1]|uniref:DNA adenine methylase n=1 Tax=Hydrogenovibrio sp. 3SP14C1 TaxID=3038774 RepID=UPI002416855F|nr:DNA adenine methylase [Hydrogenovibrio sp. 3SP14C1]MDG4811895.1 DNA adenine methylase [Hydrogenovibrio sp. 3SP14C1]